VSISEDQMLSELNLKTMDLDGVDVEVKVLYEVYKDYLKNKTSMEKQAEYLASILNSCSVVNSVKWRVKDPFHLINKIIRKRTRPVITDENKDNESQLNDDFDNSKYKDIDASNYKEIIADMIGLRAIFLFKAHWSVVDEYIFDKLKVCPDEPITIYHASDDDLMLFPACKLTRISEEYTYNYKLVEKPTRYRSIHYILEAERHTACKIELQTRTILDEAWGEIDHLVRYPHNENHPELLRKMSILNGQISGCEEHASQSYAYFSEMETSRLKSLTVSENSTTTTEFIEDNIKVEDQVYDSRNGKPYESNLIKYYSKSSGYNDEIGRISNIIKSMHPLRNFENYEKVSFLKQIENINLNSGINHYALARALNSIKDMNSNDDDDTDTV